MRIGTTALLVFVLFASACAPAKLAPAATPEAASASRPRSTTDAPRFHRIGPEGTGVSTGPIARFGAALSLTGSGRPFGSVQRNGIKLAQDEINASHILGATRLEVIIEDDASDRQRAAEVFQRFIENSQVMAILGPTLSDVALSVDPVAQQAGVPVLAISNAAGGITQIGDFIFRDCLSESQLTPQIVKAVRSRMKVHKAGLLYSDTDANRSGSRGFKKALQDMGVQIVSEQAFAIDQTDFSPQLDEIAASHADALFVTAPGHLAAPILIQARQHGFNNVPVIGSNAFNSDTMLRNAGDASEGLIVASAWSAANQSNRNQQFIQSYRARYGVDPDQLAAQAYAGLYILAAALKDAGTVNEPRLLRDALERVKNLDTPLGSFSFNDAHDADYAPSLQIVHQGHFQLL